MRIGTWNCRGGFDRKAAAALSELRPDVLVVPECHAAPAVAGDGWQYRYRHHATKGIGVFVGPEWVVHDVESPHGTERPWVLPLRIHARGDAARAFLLLAVWTDTKVSDGLSYAAQFAAVLDVWTTEIRSGPTVIAGDFNASAQGPSAVPHAANVRRAADVGLVSAYHRMRGVELGEEDEMTLRMVRGGVERGFHCDLVFLPEAWTPRVRSVAVGEWDVWTRSGRSDHAPVMVELDDWP